jgi:hypothetical protein
VSRWAAIATACLLAAGGASLPAQAADEAAPAISRFESGVSPDGKRLVMVCAKPAADSVRCGLDWQAAQGVTPSVGIEFVPLASNQRYLADLARDAADAQARAPKAIDGILPTAADVALLQQVVKAPGACLADKDRADLVLACPTGKRFEDAVVMLFRGLCDRCEFEPIVVRKVN